MGAVSQLARYLLVILLMVPLLGGALLVAPLSTVASLRMIRTWKRAVLRIFGVELEVQYEDSPAQFEGGGIIVGLNQQSLLDPTIGYAAWDQPVKAIWNFEYALIPFLGWVSPLLGWVIVRQHAGQARKQIDRAARYAANGGLVYLSAEGKRSVDGELNPYKKGPVVMAINAQAPIHPLYIVGSRRRLAPGEWRVRPGKVLVRYLSPIPTAGLTYEDRDNLLDRLRGVGEAAHAKWSAVDRNGHGDRLVTLRDARDEGGPRLLTASFSHGALVIEGRDHGAGVERVLGPGQREYEWVWTIGPEGLPLLAAALEAEESGVLEALAGRFTGDAASGLWDFLEAHDIPREVWSRVGD